MKRLFVLTVLAGAAAVGLSAAAAQRGTSQPSSAETITSGDIVLDECGIKLKKKAIVATDRPGILEFIKYEEGKAVKDGEAVAGLKADVATAAHNVAKKKAADRTEIEFAEKARDLALKELKKAEEVNKREAGTISVIEIERLELEWEKAKASVKKANMQKEILVEQEKEAKAQLATFTIVAPFNGRIRKKLKSKGEAVRQGDPILEIVNTEVVIVEGYVHYLDWKHIKVGNEVEIQLEYGASTPKPGEKLPRGKLIFVGRTVSPVTKKVFIKAEVKNNKENTTEHLFPGLTARMIIKPGTQFKE